MIDHTQFSFTRHQLNSEHHTLLESMLACWNIVFNAPCYSLFQMWSHSRDWDKPRDFQWLLFSSVMRSGLMFCTGRYLALLSGFDSLAALRHWKFIATAYKYGKRYTASLQPAHSYRMHAKNKHPSGESMYTPLCRSHYNLLSRRSQPPAFWHGLR